MSLELVYTSAPRGLKSTTPGFCTVAATAGMPRQMMMKLEALSGYEFCFSLSDPNVRLSPANFAHARLVVGGQSLSVLSRIAFAGADYSGRTNKIAHHLALAAHEELPGGPAWMLRQLQLGDGQRQLLHADWREEAHELDPRDLRTLLAARPAPAPAPARWWEQATGGDPGWAGLLLKSLRERKDAPAFVIFNPGTELLPLFEECLALLPPAERWAVGFSTYYSTLPAGCFYHWRGVLAGSTAAREVARFPNATVIDLTRRPLPRAEDNPYTQAARAGQMLPPVPQEAPSGLVAQPPSAVGADAEPSWRRLIPDSLKFRTREEAPLRLRLDAAAADDAAADDATRIARLERRLDAARRGHRQARTFAFAACAVAGLLLLLCIYAFIQRSELSSDLERLKQDYARLKEELKSKPTTKAVVAPPPEKPATKVAVAPPPEKPTTEDVVVPPPKKPTTKDVVAPPPKKPTTDVVVSPPPEKDKPKVVEPPKEKPLELGTHVRADVPPLAPASDDGQKVVFHTGPFHAVLEPPEGLERNRTLKIDRDANNPDALLVSHLSKSGFGRELLLTCKRQGGQMVWEINKDKERDYAACLDHLVLIAVTGKDKHEGYAPCTRRRDRPPARLTIVYRGDGAIVSAEKDRVWECSYPWVQQLLVRHKLIEGGKPIPLFKAPPMTGEFAEITKKDDSGRFPGILFKGKVQAPSRPKPFEIRLVLEFTLSDQPNPREGGSVTAKLSVSGLEEYLGDLESAHVWLQKLREANELADLAEELDRLREREKELLAKDPKERDGIGRVQHRIDQIRKMPNLEKRTKAAYKQFAEDGTPAKAIPRIRDAVKKELLKFRKEHDPTNWATEIKEAVQALKADRRLPHELFRATEGLTILDPWGITLATVTPVLRLEGEKDEPRPPKK